MKEIYAHYDAETGEKQHLSEHLEQVVRQMCYDLAPVSFSLVPDLCSLLYQTGMNHDLGKASVWFQRHLLEESYHDERSHHALISSIMLEATAKNPNLLTFLAMIAVKCHHGGLDTDYDSLVSYMHPFDYAGAQFDSCKKQLEGDELEKLLPPSIDTDDYRRFWRKTKKPFKMGKNTSPEPFFLLQYLFSKLISADKLDSANLLGHAVSSFHGDVESVLAAKRKGNVVNLNSSRDRIRSTVLERISSLTKEELHQKRIFTITAPTGTGKTLTGLSAALLLAERLEQAEGFRPHLISAMPFINILEQAVEDYQAVCGEVLVHYGAADPAEQFGNSELALKDKALLMNAWDAPVVITTFVQLFESILTGKNSRLLKLHRLSGAIVLLDEVQALDAKQYPLYSVVMDYAARCYGTRFILMTATQPKLFDSVNRLRYTMEHPPTELLPNFTEYFTQLKRTRLIPKWDTITDLEQLTDAVLEAAEEYDSILCVVNTVQDSIDLFHELDDAGQTVLYLSTNIISLDRKEVIRTAKEYLNPECPTPFIMVSTQTIEAGVDLDFDAAFRDLAPLESIIQTAGRVNRSGLKQDYSPVTLFNTKSGEKVYSSFACQLVLDTLTETIQEDYYQTLMDAYFEKMLSRGTTFETSIYYDGILKLDYEKISQFHMIEQQNRYPVLIVKNESVHTEILKLCEYLRQPQKSFELRIEIQRRIGRLGQYCVEVYEHKIKKNLPPSFQSIYDFPLDYYVVTEVDMNRYYDSHTGFISATSPGIFF